MRQIWAPGQKSIIGKNKQKNKSRQPAPVRKQNRKQADTLKPNVLPGEEVRCSRTADGHGKKRQKDNLLVIMFVRNTEQTEQTMTYMEQVSPLLNNMSSKLNNKIRHSSLPSKTTAGAFLDLAFRLVRRCSNVANSIQQHSSQRCFVNKRLFFSATFWTVHVINSKQWLTQMIWHHLLPWKLDFW